MGRILRVGVMLQLLGGLLVVGCGGGGGASADVGKIERTMTREFAAVADGDGAVACGLATPSGRAVLANADPGATCEEVIAFVAARLTPEIRTALHNLAIKKVTITGNTASVADADVTSTRGSLKGFDKPGSPPTILMKQPDGTWKIAG
jgi:hypothetical protein